jgi:hypothetical protein
VCGVCGVCGERRTSRPSAALTFACRPPRRAQLTRGNPKALAGNASLGNLVSLRISHDGSTARITLAGPAHVWFGVGFNADAMHNGTSPRLTQCTHSLLHSCSTPSVPSAHCGVCIVRGTGTYAVIVDGTGAVSERALGSHGPGVALAPSVAVVSSSVTDGVRTLVLSRNVSGKTPDHAWLPTSPGTLKMIAAEGSTSAFSYHHARTGAQIELLLTQSAACMCTPEEHGYLTYMDTAAREYHVGCTDEPRSDMLRKGDGTGRWGVPNAACSYKTYHGGLQCCSNQYFLTDREQAAENTTTDVYYLKWRYYFQEYVPASASTRASHKHLHHWVFLIDDAVNDYEEDNAHYGVASVGKIEAHLLGREIGLEDVPTTYSQITPLVITPHHHVRSALAVPPRDATLRCHTTRSRPTRSHRVALRRLERRRATAMSLAPSARAVSASAHSRLICRHRRSFYCRRHRRPTRSARSCGTSTRGARLAIELGSITSHNIT